MKIALLSHEYPPFIFGGIGSFTHELAAGLSRKGVDVTVIAGYPIKSKLRDDVIVTKDKNINVIRFPYPSFPPRQTFFQLLNLKKLSDTIQKLGVDVIHGQCGSTYPAIIKLRSISPILVTFHASPYMQLQLSLLSLTRDHIFQDFFTFGLGYPAWKYTFKKEFEDCSAAVSVSNSLRQQLINEMHLQSDEKIFTIPNGVDLALIDKASNGYSCKPFDEPIILFGGRLVWGKGVLSILKLAYLLKNKYSVPMKIVVYGSGSLYNRLKQEKERYNLTNLVLNRFVERSQFIQAMHQTKFVLLPSFFEACPMLLLECMCMGKIPILFNLPFSREFTNNGLYGILADNVDEMALKIKKISEDESIINTSAIAQFARKNFNINTTVNRYCELYTRLIENHK